MKILKITLAFFYAIIWFCTPLFAQNQILITINISPPYSQHFADYTQYQTQVFMSLTNVSQQDQQMKVLGEISGQGTGFFIKTRPDYIPNQIITLAPGETREFRGNEITGYLDPSNIDNNIPQDALNETLRTGLLPQDVYDYCIEVVDINTLALLGRKCAIVPIQYLSPPQPNLPLCETSQNLLINPLINFSWLPAIGALGNANIHYDFYLVPVPDGQNPAQLLDLAMNGQLPGAFFNWPDIPTTNFQYNYLELPELQTGLYVWGIVARDINGQVGIENEGRSQFCTLVLTKDQAGGGPNFQDIDPDGVNDSWDNCSCQSPPQAPIGESANYLIQPGADILVGAYTMKVVTHLGNGSGTGSISMPGFPGGVSLPILVNFEGLNINADRSMMGGIVRAQVKPNVDFLPAIPDPQMSTLPLGASEIEQLDQYFIQNAGQLMSQIANNGIGFQLPLGLDKVIGGQQVVVAITALNFDATHASLDAAVVLNLIDAGTKIALSGRNICLQNGIGFCGEADLYLAEDLVLPSVGISLRGLGANPNKCTRVQFDKDGFKKLYVEAVYKFPTQTIVKAVGGGQVEAVLSAETERGWSDWVASIGMDAFQINGVSDFTFNPGTAFYDHSSKTNLPNMPNDYVEGQTPTWTGFFLQAIQVDLPPIIKKQNTNQPLSISANNLIIDGNGFTGELNVNNILAIGEGGNGNWRFSVDNFKVKFLKNSFASGSFNGRLLLPITNRGEQSQLLYSSLLSYSNSQFAYQFVINPKENIEVDLFAALFSLSSNSNISMSYVQGTFEASATLHGNFSIGGKFVDDLPRIQLAHVDFQNLKLKTNSPYIEPGAKLTAALGSPAHSVAGLPISVTDWELVTIGIKASLNVRLSDYVGFLPNAESAFTVYGKFDNDGPAFDDFKVDKITLDADFSALKLKGELNFFHKDPNWGEGFSGVVDAVFPPGFEVSSRMQVGDKNGVGYWYVDGQTALESDFVSGLKAFGFSGGAYYNMSANGFQEKNDITVTQIASDFNQPGGAPSGVQYVVSNGSSGMLASLVIGLGSKDLFNANGALSVSFKNGGIDVLHIVGKGRMFGGPGSDGLVNGEVDVKYDFPQKIFDLGVSMTLTLPVFSGSGYLGIHSNGTTEEWNFKLGRPLGWTPGNPCIIELDLGPLDVQAGAYFQCGNYQVDGLPTMLPGFMQSLFPEYPKGYERKLFGDKLSKGDAIALGAYFLASFSQSYLIFYGEISAAFGFDLQLSKQRMGCDGSGNLPGLDGWYGQGQFYAGIKAAIGIEVDLFLISGKFEILSIAVGALLQGGGPNPTWVTGTVSGHFSILSGLIEGHCSFQFSAGEKCIISRNPLDDLKIINELTPMPDSPNDVVSQAQSVETDPAVTVNLKMGKEFFLDEIKNVNGEQVTVPRLFKFDQSNLQLVSFKQISNNHTVLTEKEYDAEGYGLMLWLQETLKPREDYILTFEANVNECSLVNKEALSEDGQSGHVLYYGTCNGVWNAAEKDGRKFKETRTVRFRTDAGLLRLNPDKVVYSLPHHGQRFFCYQDISEQAILALTQQKVAADFLGNPANEAAPKRISVRLIPHGQSADAMESIPVEQFGFTGVDPSLLGDYREDYQASRPLHYWSAFKYRMLQPNTTYGVQYFIEWETPPSQTPSNIQAQKFSMSTKTFQRSLLSGAVQVNERQLNLEKYKLRSNQREIYRYYFRTGDFSAIEQKLAALDCNQLSFKEYKADGTSNFLPFTVWAPDAGDWQVVAQQLQNYYPPSVLNPTTGSGYNDMPTGIILNKVGFTGAEKFDVFDAYGFEKKITNGVDRTYRIRPLLEMDEGPMNTYWNDYFKKATEILTQNGISEARFRKPTANRDGWIMGDPKLKFRDVQPSLDTNNVMGSANPSLQVMFGQNNFSSFSMNQASSNNALNPMIQMHPPNLIEITRDLERWINPQPGYIPLGNNWLNDMLQGGGMSDIPGQYLQNQFLSNIGMGYDFVNNQQGMYFTPQQSAGGYGGVQINIISNNINKPNIRIGRN